MKDRIQQLHERIQLQVARTLGSLNAEPNIPTDLGEDFAQEFGEFSGIQLDNPLFFTTSPRQNNLKCAVCETAPAKGKAKHCEFCGMTTCAKCVRKKRAHPGAEDPTDLKSFVPICVSCEEQYLQILIYEQQIISQNSLRKAFKKLNGQKNEAMKRLRRAAQNRKAAEQQAKNAITLRIQLQERKARIQQQLSYQLHQEQQLKQQVQEGFKQLARLYRLIDGLKLVIEQEALQIKQAQALTATECQLMSDPLVYPTLSLEQPNSEAARIQPVVEHRGQEQQQKLEDTKSIAKELITIQPIKKDAKQLQVKQTPKQEQHQKQQSSQQQDLKPQLQLEYQQIIQSSGEEYQFKNALLRQQQYLYQVQISPNGPFTNQLQSKVTQSWKSDPPQAAPEPQQLVTTQTKQVQQKQLFAQVKQRDEYDPEEQLDEKSISQAVQLQQDKLKAIQDIVRDAKLVPELKTVQSKLQRQVVPAAPVVRAVEEQEQLLLPFKNNFQNADTQGYLAEQQLQGPPQPTSGLNDSTQTPAQRDNYQCCGVF